MHVAYTPDDSCPENTCPRLDQHMPSATCGDIELDQELTKYVHRFPHSLSFTSISNVWGFLTGDSLRLSTPEAKLRSPTVDLCDSFEPARPWASSVDETTTVGSGRSMSIFESFDDVCYSPPSLVDVPKTKSHPSDAGSFLEDLCEQSRPASGGSSDKINAEASALIKEHGRKGDLQSCWTIWNNLIQDTQVPNEITVGCMVDALVSNREVRHAESLVNQWKHKVSPNTVVYSTLIHGWAKQNDAKRALNIFNQMRAEKVPCNAVTYNCMIHACVRVGDMQGSLDLLAAMQEAPSALRPDKFTYSTIIKGYCGRGEIENALFLFESMLRERLVPDLVIYNTLLDGCVKTRHNEVCDKLLDDMVSQWRIHPNSYTLSILIKRFGRQGDLTKAFQLVEQLPRKYGFRANAHVWTCLISACVTHGRLTTAECVFASMSGDSRLVHQLLQSNTEVESPAELKLLSDALSLASLCPPDAKTYETLAQGYLRFNEARKAMDVVLEGLGKFRGKLSHQCVAQVAQVGVQYGMDISQLIHSCGGRGSDF